jgi:peptide/nickel transport system permease protein
MTVSRPSDTDTSHFTALSGAIRERRRLSLWARLLNMRLAGIGLLLVIAVVVIAVLAPLIAPHDPATVALIDRLKPPLTPGHLFGTDSLGQDVLSRVIYGARVSSLIGFFAVVIAGTLGITLGLLSGYYGGWLDSLIMRIGDIQLAFPTIILYVAVMAVLGPGLFKLIVVMGFVGWVPYGRVQRGMVFSVREQEYVEASRAIGAPDWVILVRHILPNTLGPLVVVASFGVAQAIITEASLSFLGLGVPPSVPSWGSMLADGRNYLQAGWWIATFPGVAITMTVLAVNLLGDWLRDRFDPLLRVK